MAHFERFNRRRDLVALGENMKTLADTLMSRLGHLQYMLRRLPATDAHQPPLKCTSQQSFLMLKFYKRD